MTMTDNERRRTAGGPLLYYKLTFWAFGSGELKIWTPTRFAVIIQKLEQYRFATVIGPKDADEMANSVDPGQTAPGSTLFP